VKVFSEKIRMWQKNITRHCSGRAIAAAEFVVMPCMIFKKKSGLEGCEKNL